MNIYGMTLLWAGILALNVISLVLQTSSEELSMWGIAFTVLVCAVCSWKLQYWILRGIRDFNEDDNP